MGDGREGEEAEHEGGGMTVAAARFHCEETSSDGSTSASSPLCRSLLLSSRLVAPMNRHVRDARVRPWSPPCSELGHDRRRAHQHAHMLRLKLGHGRHRARIWIRSALRPLTARCSPPSLTGVVAAPPSSDPAAAAISILAPARLVER